MKSVAFAGRQRRAASGGFTLIELIVATSILLILTSLAIPLARVSIKREKERELRRALWDMRDAIDRYKDTVDRGAIQPKLGSDGYPPDLDTLVKGVDVGGKKMRFLRKIPIDPMTNGTEWGMRSEQDDPDSDSFAGDDVFDVYTKSLGTGLDGTKYKDW
jgi:general secretion pathway protein G